MMMLQAQIKYEQDDLIACKSMTDQCAKDEPETSVAYACIAFKVLKQLDKCVIVYLCSAYFI